MLSASEAEFAILSEPKRYTYAGTGGTVWVTPMPVKGLVRHNSLITVSGDWNQGGVRLAEPVAVSVDEYQTMLAVDAMAVASDNADELTSAAGRSGAAHDAVPNATHQHQQERRDGAPLPHRSMSMLLAELKKKECDFVTGSGFLGLGASRTVVEALGLPRSCLDFIPSARQDALTPHYSKVSMRLVPSTVADVGGDIDADIESESSSASASASASASSSSSSSLPSSLSLFAAAEAFSSSSSSASINASPSVSAPSRLPRALGAEALAMVAVNKVSALDPELELQNITILLEALAAGHEPHGLDLAAHPSLARFWQWLNLPSTNLKSYLVDVQTSAAGAAPTTIAPTFCFTLDRVLRLCLSAHNARRGSNVEYDQLSRNPNLLGALRAPLALLNPQEYAARKKQPAEAAAPSGDGVASASASSAAAGADVDAAHVLHFEALTSFLSGTDPVVHFVSPAGAAAMLFEHLGHLDAALPLVAATRLLEAVREPEVSTARALRALTVSLPQLDKRHDLTEVVDALDQSLPLIGEHLISYLFERQAKEVSNTIKVCLGLIPLIFQC